MSSNLQQKLVYGTFSRNEMAHEMAYLTVGHPYLQNSYFYINYIKDKIF